MIKAIKLDKYYNRNKRNQIHVIDQVNLELPNKGLVVLLGPSGSGKTTLLNVLGGLDRASGQVVIDEHVMTNYNMGKWDKIRNEKIGYIFQNYMLLEHLSIYENIKLVLNMAGISDKQEINKRIEYLLEKVGMKNFKKRKAGMLSGGQQQRVAIARALSKNPEVIIADEPTGNLDSKNTIEIMNIIKKISKTKLVLLVTHEKELANFYADRIIEIEDGKIASDNQSTSTGSLDLKHDADIYLKDLNHKGVEESGIRVDYYSDQTNHPDLKLKFVLKNGTLYLELDEKIAKSIKVLDKKSEIQLIDKHYEKVESKSIESLDKYDFENIIDETKRNKSQSIITAKHAFLLAFSKISNLSTKRKFLYLSFILAGFLLTIATSLLTRVLIPNDRAFMSYPKNYVKVEDINSQADLESLLTDPTVLYHSQVDLTFTIAYDIPTVYQEMWWKPTNYVRKEYAEIIDKSNIVYGDPISGNNEVLLDISLYKGRYNQTLLYLSHFGIRDYKDLKDTNILVGGKSYKVVGFTDIGYSVLVMSELDFYQHVLNDESRTDLAQMKLDHYSSIDRNQLYLYAYSQNPTATVASINEYATATYEYPILKEAFMLQMNFIYSALYVFVMIIFILTWVGLFFVMRSALLERISEISVYRALGVRRFDIIKSYFIEVFVITSVSFVVGYFFGFYYFTQVNKGLVESQSILFTPISIGVTVLLIYVFNVVIGLMPVTSLLRRTPSQIMSSYDA